MIVKIKTFSGETLYIPEEDYLDEVMYSNAQNKAAKKAWQAAQGKKFLGILQPRGGLEGFARDHRMRPDYKAVERWRHNPANTLNQPPLTRLQKLKLDREFPTGPINLKKKG